MAFSLLKFKSIFSSHKNGRLSGSGSLEPEIGFKLVHNPVTKYLYVTVIGARHLPSLFGLSRAKGYTVKVKIFPGNAKFESKLQESSWPIWDEEFKFLIDGHKKAKKGQESTDLATQLSGHFISLTVYAVLETAAERQEAEKKKKGFKGFTKSSSSQKSAATSTTTVTTSSSTSTDPQSTSKLSKFEKIVTETFKSDPKKQGNKGPVDKRRTIGVATWSFDVKLFENKLKYDLIGTPDIWRKIEQIGSGMSLNNTQENKKGKVEVTLMYCKSENGQNDSIQISVQKMHCTIETMQEQELHKSPIYLKVAISNRSMEAHWKSDLFMPTISQMWDPKTSGAKLTFNSSSLDQITIYVSLGCKNSMAVKENLGKVVIGEKTSCAEVWRKMLEAPGVPKTFWLFFE